MIDYSISDPTKKFELIWSCILKVMIFTIYRNFSGIFLILIKFISNFYHLKRLNKMQKLSLSRSSPRGCDVAVRATWQRHADPRVCAYVALR